MTQSPLDTRLASLGLLLGAGMLAYSYYKARQGVGPLAAPPAGGGAGSTGGSSGALSSSGGGGTLSPLEELTAWAGSLGLTITSGQRTAAQEAALGGPPTSLHVLGRAIDVSVAGLSGPQIQSILDSAHAQGFNAFFEGQGNTPYGYSTGNHLHVSISPPGSHAQ